MKGLRIKLISLGICVVLTIGVASAIKGFSYFADFVEDFRGYDYDSKIAKGYDWVGPKPGEIIDTNYLVNTNGTTLGQLPRNDLLLFTVVDPTCGACKQTREQLRFLDENLSGKGIDYFIVCFSPKVSPLELSDYVKSLSLDTDSLSWSNGLETELSSIKTIAYPSHILVNSNGTVIKSFPGTSVEKPVRDRMVREVISQIIVERDRLHSS